MLVTGAEENDIMVLEFVEDVGFGIIINVVTGYAGCLGNYN